MLRVLATPEAVLILAVSLIPRSTPAASLSGFIS